MLRVVVAAACFALSCTPQVQRAAIVAAPPCAAASATALAIHADAQAFVVDPARSRFEIFGRDFVTGEHKMTFGVWRANVTIGPTFATIDAVIDTSSLVVDMAGATGIVKRHLLETDRYPSATLTATLQRSQRASSDPYVVEGIADLHGVKRSLRFEGQLVAVADGYRFTTSFVISRKEFAIRYGPAEAFLSDDVRIDIDAFALPAPARPAPARPAPARPAPAREATPSSPTPDPPTPDPPAPSSPTPDPATPDPPTPDPSR